MKEIKRQSLMIVRDTTIIERHQMTYNPKSKLGFVKK